MPSFNLWVVLLLLGHLDLSIAAGPYQSLEDAFDGRLANLSGAAPWGNPYLGGQDYYHCCLLAVNDSLEIQDGNLTYRPGQSILRGSLDDFLADPFPCDSTNDGSNGYPPQVWISYNWCNQNCPGWAMSWIDSFSLRLWLKPLAAFITPAAIFALNIPRRRKIEVPRRFFPRNLNSPLQILALVYKIPLAVIIVTLDLVIWTIVTLTFAGPMLVSGIYEALLDMRLLNYLRRRIWRNSLSVRQRAHLLVILLFGSLDEESAWDDSKRLVSELPHDNLRRRFSSITSANGVFSSPVPDADGNGHGNVPPGIQRASMAAVNHSARKQIQVNYTPAVTKHIDIMKIKLRAALQSQMSFGAAAGAAVVFYVGNFAYTLVELQADFGRTDLSHQLAFGMMWMTIPHVAIICCLLLACNNPNIWETMIVNNPERTDAPAADDNGTRLEDSSSQNTGRKVSFLRLLKFRSIYKPVYEKSYRVAWIWNRGQCKASWILKFSEEYPMLATSIRKEVLQPNFTSMVISLTPPAVFLMLLPPFLGAMVSYTTPAIGLGCRSLSLLMYMGGQLVLMILWLVDWVFWSLRRRGRADEAGIMVHISNVFWYTFFFIALLASFFSGIMGTVFVLMSLFANCLCQTPAIYWLSRWTNPNAVFYLGNYTDEQIWYAEHYWMPTGIAAACFLVAMTYIGWWYSCRMKNQFMTYTNSIDVLDEEDFDENKD